MTKAIERIEGAPLKAERASVRVAADGYHVATVSPGMNDREAYAALFAASLDMLAALKAWHAMLAPSEKRFPSTPGSKAAVAFAMAEAAIAKAEGRADV